MDDDMRKYYDSLVDIARVKEQPKKKIIKI